MTELDEYKKWAQKASFHYADDSAKEWGIGDEAKQKALAIFDANPELQEEMRQVVTLWSINRERPRDE